MPRVPPNQNDPDKEGDHAKERREEFLKKRFPGGIPPSGERKEPSKTGETVEGKNEKTTKK